MLLEKLICGLCVLLTMIFVMLHAACDACVCTVPDLEQPTLETNKSISRCCSSDLLKYTAHVPGYLKLLRYDLLELTFNA